MNVGELIFEAAVMSGMTSAIDTLPPEEANYGFSKLNQFVDECAADRLMIFRSQRVGPFNVTSGQGNITANSPITIGSGATWDTPRPPWIDYAGVIYTAGNTPNPELPMHVFTVQEWKRIVVKGITATLSRALMYDHDFTPDGFGKIYLYPVPSASFQTVLYVPVAVSEFPLDANGNPDFNTIVSLPHGYRGMLVSNLAKIMSIGVLPISDDLREEATRTMAIVKASNVETFMDALNCDEATQSRGENNRTSGWDFITGEIN